MERQAQCHVGRIPSTLSMCRHMLLIWGPLSSTRCASRRGDTLGPLLDIPRARMEPHASTTQSTNPCPSVSPQSSDVLPAPHPVSSSPIAGVRYNQQTSPLVHDYPGLATCLVWCHGRHEDRKGILYRLGPAHICAFPTFSQTGDPIFRQYNVGRSVCMIRTELPLLLSREPRFLALALGNCSTIIA